MTPGEAYNSAASWLQRLSVAAPPSSSWPPPGLEDIPEFGGSPTFYCDPTRYKAGDRDEALLVLRWIHQLAAETAHRLSIGDSYREAVKGAVQAGLYESLTAEARALVQHALTTPLDWATQDGNVRRLLQWVVGEVWCARDNVPAFVAWAADGRAIIPADAYRHVMREAERG